MVEQKSKEYYSLTCKIREIHTSEPTPRGFLEHRLPCVVHVPPAAASRLRGKDRAWPGLAVLAVQPSAGKAPAPGVGEEELGEGSGRFCPAPESGLQTLSL